MVQHIRRYNVLQLEIMLVSNKEKPKQKKWCSSLSSHHKEDKNQQHNLLIMEDGIKTSFAQRVADAAGLNYD